MAIEEPILATQRPLEAVFPNDKFFSSLLSCAERFPGDPIAVNDPANGVSATYNQLIGDIVSTRKAIYNSWSSELFDSQGTLKGSPWVGLLVPTSYEFVVGCLVILSIGGAIMPMPKAILSDEADHFFEQCDSTLMIVGSKHPEVALKIQAYRHVVSHRTIQSIPVTRRDRSEHQVDIIHLDDSIDLPSDRPGLVVFTSGTTGPPKGAVLPRCSLYPRQPCTPENRLIKLCDRPAHWIGGYVGLFPLLLSGHGIEILPPGSPAVDYWELLRQQRVTRVTWGPMMFSQLKQYYEDHLRLLPEAELEPYLQGARVIQGLRAGSAMPAPVLLDFWQKMVGKPLQMGYSATEAGGLMSALLNVGSAKPSSIGKPIPGVEMKLSEGKTGEILVKSPRIMLRYLNNPEATRAAFTEDGFYRTGDMAHMDGDEFIFDGRVSSDFVQVYAYRVPILEVENAVIALPYVAEAAVVAVPDPACANQIGAVIRLRPGMAQMPLDKLRNDLSPSLPAYTLPTKLRVLDDDEMLPRTVSYKIQRKQTATKFFGDSAAVDRVQVCPKLQAGKDRPVKAWDWAGLQ
ncbi:hypothetical protein PEBR_18219 [Penicillium brasilianum]|uniref:AMP-dependent synthetase/ligase domain-containing protein n=1 Tax=Penicillium brasilianum TaxID=104259 RepID=A0A1S9RQH4_PENBI|nr:hypothetical protein PEBR_18219 [Penicillium brasilianum]